MSSRIDFAVEVGNIPTLVDSCVVDCMTTAKAVEQLHECLETGEIVLTKHFKDELSNGCIPFEDAWIVLKYGRIFTPPEEDTRTAEWVYRIKGHEPGGKWIVIAFCSRR